MSLPGCWVHLEQGCWVFCSVWHRGNGCSQATNCPLDRWPSLPLPINFCPAELRLSGHDHHILFIQLDGHLWLADVGFGGEGREGWVLFEHGGF